MLLIQSLLSDLILASVQNAQSAAALPEFELPSEAPINRPKQSDWGEFSSALGMQLARPARKNPLKIAEILIQHIPDSEIVGAVTVSPPGFVNFTLAAAWLQSQMETILQAGSSYADLDLGKGASAQVEYVSANPTGPLTVGHGRGGVLGDTLANLLEAYGYEVTREYYFNNAGQQMRNLGESLRLRYLEALGEEIELPDGYYKGEYLIETGQALAAEHGEDLRAAGWEHFKDLAEEAMSGQQKDTLTRLDIFMDVYFNEHSLYEDGSIERVRESLSANDYIYEEDGALWFAATKLGASKDRVVIKSSGEPTYLFPDIAYHRNKLDRGFKLVVDVLGADHKDQFPDVQRGVQALGYDASRLKMLMNQFITIKGERMSKREGHFTSLNDLIDEVGGDVVRFFMLMRSAESHLEFDLELARERSDKNPVFYVQYAHARICSILRKAEQEGFSPWDGDASLLVHPSELALVRALLELSEVIDLCVRELAPHHLTTYARELASTFHAFYRDCRVLDSDAPELTRSRLKLVTAARAGLARTLGLIGVAAPESM